jgi:hypothetical protein
MHPINTLPGHKRGYEKCQITLTKCIIRINWIKLKKPKKLEIYFFYCFFHFNINLCYTDKFIYTLDYAINITLKDVYLGFIITFLTNATLALGPILIRIIKDTTIDAMD